MEHKLKKEKGTIKITGKRIMWISFDYGDIFWDIGSFRPDITEELKENIEYDADIFLDNENLLNGKVITFPRKIEHRGKFFVNIR